MMKKNNISQNRCFSKFLENNFVLSRLSPIVNQMLSLLVPLAVISNAIMIGISVSIPEAPLVNLLSPIIWLTQLGLIWTNCAVTIYRTRTIPLPTLILSILSSIPIDSCRITCLMLVMPKFFITRISRRVYTIWLETLPGMLWGILIITCSLWVMAIIYTDFFSSSTAWIFEKSSAENFFDVPKYFGSNVRSFHTMLQIITMDHWMSSIARPLISQYPIMLLFPLSLLFVFTYGLLNVMIGLVVRCSILLSDDRQSLKTSVCGDQYTDDRVVQRLLVRRKIGQIISRLKSI